MDALNFLYIALGVGFLVLVVFISVCLLYVIQILRDMNKITDSVSDTATRINDYVIQPFALISQVVDQIKPIIGVIQAKREQMEQSINKKAHEAAKKYRNK